MKCKSACVPRLAAHIPVMVALSALAVVPVNAAGGDRTVGNVWRHGNIVACAVNHNDSRNRTPEQTAEMLKNLGIRKFAYNWAERDVPNFDAVISALKKSGIELNAWMLYSSDLADTQRLLEMFRRHHVAPALWIQQMSQARDSGHEQLTAEQQRQRVSEVADRIAALQRLAAPYGVKIALYNNAGHDAWLGNVDNQLAVLASLMERKIADVGMVYNFSHARDKWHDDSRSFAELWPRMKAHVVEINITGMSADGQIVYPSQGDSELEMMRVIQQSGWRGRVGVIAEKGGDAEITLRNYLVGLDWLAAELNKPGSAGHRPFATTP